jgi:DNA primase
MSAPFVSFRAVKDAVSMRQLLERYGLLDSLKRRGADGLTGPCPIHRGTNPTQFRVSLAKNCWNCFGGCGGGNVLDFVAAMEEADLRKAALLVAEWFGVESRAEKPSRPGAVKQRKTPPEREATAATPPTGVAEPVMPSEEGETGDNPPLRFAGLKDLDAGHPFLVAHGFSREAMEELGVGYCRKGLMKERIAIPIHNARGELVAYAGRALDDRPRKGGASAERYRYPDGFRREWELYNVHRAFRARKTNGWGFLVTEDFLDVFRLYEAGYENAVAFMGRSVSPRQTELLAGAVGRKSGLTLFLEEGAGLAEILLSLARDFAVRLIPHRPETLTVADIRALLEENP